MTEWRGSGRRGAAQLSSRWGGGPVAAAISGAVSQSQWGQCAVHHSHATRHEPHRPHELQTHSLEMNERAGCSRDDTTRESECVSTRPREASKGCVRVRGGYMVTWIININKHVINVFKFVSQGFVSLIRWHIIDQRSQGFWPTLEARSTMAFYFQPIKA